MGVLFAREGDLLAAKNAFEAVLEIDPGSREASYNLEQVERVVDSLIQAGAFAELDSADRYEASRFQEYRESMESQEQAQQSAQQYQGKGDVTEMGSRELDEQSIDFFDTGGQLAPFDPQGARESLLRTVEEDPSIFLRRKFAHQLRNRNPKPEASDETW
jgi:Ca-activated chloride channel family protein